MRLLRTSHLHRLAALAVLLLVAGAAARAQPPERRAGLVVQFGDGSLQTACVRFSEETISGLDLLLRAGLSVVVQTGGIGAAVCKIGPDGCNYPAESCFCKRDGARSIYWAFYTLQNDTWAYASLGAANVAVGDGDVHGWAWGLGDASGGALPPVRSIDTICAPATAPAPTAPPATASPAPAPTSAPPAAPGASLPAPAPTATAPAAPTATARPTRAPQATATTSVAPAPPPAGAVAGGVDEPLAASGPPWGYLAFGVMLVGLGVGIVLAARRR